MESAPAQRQVTVKARYLPDDVAADFLVLPQAAPASRQAIERALEQSRGTVSQAVPALGISRQTLYLNMPS